MRLFALQVVLLAGLTASIPAHAAESAPVGRDEARAVFDAARQALARRMAAVQTNRAVAIVPKTPAGSDVSLAELEKLQSSLQKELQRRATPVSPAVVQPPAPLPVAAPAPAVSPVAVAPPKPSIPAAPPRKPAVRFEQGATYVGDWSDDRMSGSGTMTWTNGARYHGGYLQGLREGWGVFRFADGATYEGYWRADRMEGHGRYKCRAWTYDGDWASGLRQGRGRFVRADGWSYDGEWADDVMHGYGTESRPDGRRRSGFWIRGQFIEP